VQHGSVLVPLEELRHACQAARQAAERLRALNLSRLVEGRLAAARRHNQRWWAIGFLRVTEDKGVIEKRILDSDPLNDASWLHADIPVKLLERAMDCALEAHVRPDRQVVLSERVWHQLDVYRARSNFWPIPLGSRAAAA